MFRVDLKELLGSQVNCGFSDLYPTPPVFGVFHTEYVLIYQTSRFDQFVLLLMQKLSHCPATSVAIKWL